ncbi:hypothetical protein CDO73_08655 [Saccharibacillus sp. O23]|nr:hypothetical protein CDO73_08655 [Saccharibacillus sp. O23]
MTTYSCWISSDDRKKPNLLRGSASFGVRLYFSRLRAACSRVKSDLYFLMPSRDPVVVLPAVLDVVVVAEVVVADAEDAEVVAAAVAAPAL